MKLSVVLSTQQTSFQAATLSGGLEDNMKWLAALGYEGVELAIREPKLVSLPDLLALTSKYNLAVPAVVQAKPGTRKVCLLPTQTQKFGRQP